MTRAAVLGDGVPGGFAGVYRPLSELETLGRCRRGYFLAGLGGAQFAMPGAVERLRDVREPDTDPVALVLGAADPAQPFGAAVPWPRRGANRGPSRTFGAQVVLLDGAAGALPGARWRAACSRCASRSRSGWPTRSPRSPTGSGPVAVAG